MFRKVWATRRYLVYDSKPFMGSRRFSNMNISSNLTKKTKCSSISYQGIKIRIRIRIRMFPSPTIHTMLYITVTYSD
jgi:hypothetical protein